MKLEIDSERGGGGGPRPEDLRRWFSTRPTDSLVRLSTHCVDQYRERFEPDSPPRLAKGHLYGLVKGQRCETRFSVAPPDWLRSPNRDRIGFLVIDDRIALPLRVDDTGLRFAVAVTCLYRVES